MSEVEYIGKAEKLCLKRLITPCLCDLLELEKKINEMQKNNKRKRKIEEVLEEVLDHQHHQQLGGDGGGGIGGGVGQLPQNTPGKRKRTNKNQVIKTNTLLLKEENTRPETSNQKPEENKPLETPPEKPGKLRMKTKEDIG